MSRRILLLLLIAPVSRRILLLLLIALVAVPRVAQAQCAPPMPCIPYEPDDSDLERQVRLLGINAALGGVTAGVLHTLRGGDFIGAFLKGALGGTVTYGAKRLAVQDFDGAGFLARQVGSVGDSFVRNAAEGVPLLDRMYFPLWLVRLEVHPHSDARVIQPRIDVLTTGLAVHAMFDSGRAFDLGRSLSAGALVYHSSDEIARDDRGLVAYGATVGGVILLTDLDHRTEAERTRTFAHERVHVLQLDQVHAYWTGPAESWAMRSLGAHGLARWIDINLAPHFFAMYSGLRWEDRPWEKEADWITS